MVRRPRNSIQLRRDPRPPLLRTPRPQRRCASGMVPLHFNATPANMRTRAVQGCRRYARARRQCRIPTASRSLPTFSGGDSWAEPLWKTAHSPRRRCASGADWVRVPTGSVSPVGGAPQCMIPRWGPRALPKRDASRLGSLSYGRSLDWRLRLPDSGLVRRLCPVSSGSGHV